MYNFDKIDIKIVNLLLEDGRMPASEIARQIGNISERAVRYRIDRMMDEGVVRVSAVAKPQAFGYADLVQILQSVWRWRSWSWWPLTQRRCKAPSRIEFYSFF